MNRLKTLLKFFRILGFLWLSRIVAHGLLPDTLVATSGDSWQEIHEVTLEQEVLSWCGEPVRVQEVHKAEIKRLICLHLANGEVLILAPEQELLSVKNLMLENGLNHQTDVEWLMASSIDPGAYLLALGEEVGYVKVDNVEIVNLIDQYCQVITLGLASCQAFCITKGLIVTHSCST